MRRFNLLAAIGLAIFIAAGRGLAQSNNPQQRPAFEEAAVKVSTLDFFGGGPYFMPGGRFRIIAANLRMLLAVAYSYDWGGPLAPHEIISGPKWIDSARFDIEAISDVPGAADSTALLRLQRLLEERFDLKVHQESREMPVLTIVKAKAGADLGPNLRQSEGRCAAENSGRLAPPPPDSSASQPPCGLSGAAGHLEGRGVTLSQLATRISSYPTIARWVFDRTGLNGRFDFDLTWTPTTAATAPAAPAAPAPPDAPSLLGADGAPALATALEEQLGLKLQTSRAAVKVFVVDSASMPKPQ